MEPSVPVVAYVSAILTGSLLLASAGLLRKYRQSGYHGLYALVGVIVGVTLYGSLMATMKFATSALWLKVIFYRLEMVAWVGLPVSTLAFVVIGLYYTDDMGTRPLTDILGFLAGLTLISLIVPQQMLFTSPELVTVGNSVSLEHDLGGTAAILTGVGWALSLVGVGLVSHRFIHDRAVPTVISIATLIPIFAGIVGLLKLSGIYPAGGQGFNLAPVVTSAVVVAFGAFVSRRGFRASFPDDRYAALEDVGDGYISAASKSVFRDSDDTPSEGSVTSVVDSVLSRIVYSPGTATGEENVSTPDTSPPTATTSSAVVAGGDGDIGASAGLTADGTDSGASTASTDANAAPFATPSASRGGMGRASPSQSGRADDSPVPLFWNPDIVQNRAQTRVLQSRDHLTAGLPVGVFRIDPTSPPRVVHANDRAAELFGFADREAVSGSTVWDVFGSTELIDDDSIRSSETDPRPVEHEFSPPNGESFWGLVSVYKSHTGGTNQLEGVIVDITPEKRAEEVLRETLTSTERDFELVDQLWKLSVSFSGFEDFAEAALSVVVSTWPAESACVVRAGQVSASGVEIVAEAGALPSSHDGVAEAIDETYTDETQHTRTIYHEGDSLELVTTPIFAEHVVDSVLVVAASSSRVDSLRSLTDDVATALGYKRTLDHRERHADDDQFVQLDISVPNADHPLSQIIATADVDPSALSFSTARVDDECVWILTRGSEADCDTLAEAAAAHEAGEPEQLTAVDGEHYRCEIGVETAAMYHKLSLEGVRVVDISANARATELRLHLPTNLKVSAIIDVVRTRFPSTRLQSRQTVEPEPVAPRTFTDLGEDERQALEVATQMGFFERPQGATAGEVANALDTSRSTVTRRIRSGESTVFDNLVGSSASQSDDDADGSPDDDSAR